MLLNDGGGRVVVEEAEDGGGREIPLPQRLDLLSVFAFLLVVAFPSNRVAIDIMRYHVSVPQ